MRKSGVVAPAAWDFRQMSVTSQRKAAAAGLTPPPPGTAS